MVRLVVTFEMRNEKLQAVTMQQDTIQIDLEGTGKSTLRYFNSGKPAAENTSNFVTHYIKHKAHWSPWTLQWIQDAWKSTDISFQVIYDLLYHASSARKLRAA